MKSLNLNQMETYTGGDYCTAGTVKILLSMTAAVVAASTGVGFLFLLGAVNFYNTMDSVMETC